jgi:hypothetical protein
VNNIADFQLPIADWQFTIELAGPDGYSNQGRANGNQKLEIGN